MLASPCSSVGSRDYRLDAILTTTKESTFENDIDQAGYETLQVGHKYKLAGNEDGDMLINTARSNVAKEKFKAKYGTQY